MPTRKTTLVVLFALCQSCHPERPATQVTQVEKRVQFVTSVERQPPADVETFGDQAFFKVVEHGDGAVIEADGTGFHGFAETFYTDDGYDTGTSLEYRPWSAIGASYRALFSGRRIGDRLRTWDCAQRTPSKECRVYDLQILPSTGG